MEKEINGIPFEIRPLTRGEVKALRKAGLPLDRLTLENAEDAFDEVLRLVFGDSGIAEVDNLPNDKALELFRAIVDLTYGRDAEKNSPTSGDGTSGAGQTGAVGA